MSDVLVNIDVPDLAQAEHFYVEAFGLRAARRFGAGALEMTGWPVKVYLLQRPAGSIGAADEQRRYGRHWTPLHLDVVVPDVHAALDRAVAAGAVAETAVRSELWGDIVTLADPFGHGFCLLAFSAAGYDAIADAPAA